MPTPFLRRLLREAAGIHQRELALAAGVTAATISRWESGTREPRGEAAAKYAMLLERLCAEVVA